MSDDIEARFNGIEWHDSVLLELYIDRRAAGERDEVVMLIQSVQGRVLRFRFFDCYAFEATMNFGIVALESISFAQCLHASSSLDRIRASWTTMGVNLDRLLCFELVTSSTNSEIRIYCNSCDIREIDEAPRLA